MTRGESLTAKFSRGFVWGHAGKIGIWALTLLTSITIARGFGPRNYGLWTASFSLGATLMLFLSLGLERSVAVYLPRFAADRGKVGALIRPVLGIRVLAALAAILFLWAFSPAVSRWSGIGPGTAVFAWLGGAAVAVGTVSTLWKQIFDAQIKTRLTALIEMGGKSLYLFVALLVVFLARSIRPGPEALADRSLIPLYWGTIAIFIFTIIIYTRIGWPILRAPAAPVDLRPVVKFSFFSWLIVFVNYFLGKHADIILITKLTGDLRETAYYNVAFGLLTTLGLALGAGFAEITVPILSEVRSKKGEAGLAETWQVMLKAVIILCFTGVLFLLKYSRPIVDAVYSSQYQGAGRVLLIYSAFYCVSYLLGGGLNTSLLYVLNQERMILIIRLTMGIGNVCLNLWLIPRYGARGAALATGITGVLVVLLEIALIRRRIAIHYPFIFSLKMAAAALAAVILTSLIPFQTLPALILKAILYLAATVFFASVLKPLGSRDRDLLSRAYPGLGWVVRHFSGDR